VREHRVAVFGPADGRALVNASDPNCLPTRWRLRSGRPRARSVACCRRSPPGS
jgi:hypothetical protein